MDRTKAACALGAGALGWIVGKLIRREHRESSLGVSAEEYIRDLREFERRLQDIANPPRPAPAPYDPRVPQTAEGAIPDAELDRLRRELCPLIDTYNSASGRVQEYARGRFAAEMSRLDPFTRGLLLEYLARVCLDPRSRLLTFWATGAVEFPPPLPPITTPTRTRVVFGEPVRTYTPTIPPYYQAPPTPVPTGTTFPPGTETFRVVPRTTVQPPPAEPTPTAATGLPLTSFGFSPFVAPTPFPYPPVATPRTVPRATPLEVPFYQDVTIPSVTGLPPVATPGTRPSITFGEPVRTYTPTTPTYYQTPPPPLPPGAVPPGTETLRVGPRRVPVATPRTVPRTVPLEIPEYQPTTLPTGRAEPQPAKCPPYQVETAQGCVPEGPGVATPSRFPGFARLLPLVGGLPGGGIQAPTLGTNPRPFARRPLFG